MKVYEEWKHIRVGEIGVTAYIAVAMHPSEKSGSLVVTECWTQYPEQFEQHLDVELLKSLDVYKPSDNNAVIVRRAIADADEFFKRVERIVKRANESLASERAAQKELTNSLQDEDLPF
jgi:hypothetical protein